MSDLILIILYLVLQNIALTCKTTRFIECRGEHYNFREKPERKIVIEGSGMLSTTQSAANDKTETLNLPLLI